MMVNMGRDTHFVIIRPQNKLEAREEKEEVTCSISGIDDWGRGRRQAASIGCDAWMGEYEKADCQDDGVGHQ